MRGAAVALATMAVVSACAPPASREAAPASPAAASAAPAAPAAASAAPSGSAEGSGGPVQGFFVDGTRICVTNRTGTSLTALPRNQSEESNSRVLEPSQTYCAAGYNDSVTSRSDGDIVIRLSGDAPGLPIVLVGNNVAGVSGVDASVFDGPETLHLAAGGRLAVGQSIQAATLNGGPIVTVVRKPDCCGWKQFEAVLESGQSEGAQQ